MSTVLYNIARVIADGRFGIDDASHVTDDANAVTLTEAAA